MWGFSQSQAMQAQASVHDNSLTLQTQEADLQAVFMHLQTVSSANPFGAASLVIRRGFREPSSPFSHPFPIGCGNCWKACRHRLTRLIFTFNFHPTTFAVVGEILKNIKPNKAQGYDLIPPSVVKASSQTIARPLSNLINTVITRSEVPDTWKHSVYNNTWLGWAYYKVTSTRSDE